MAKGTETPSELVRHADPVTGGAVWQLTAHPSINHPTYFLQPSFTPDGENLLFISNRTGAWQLFLISQYPLGPVRQLTDAHPIHPFSPAPHPDGESVFFVRGAAIWRLDVRTLQEYTVVDFGSGSMGEPSLDAAGQWLVAAIKKDGQSGLAVGRIDGSNWHIIPFPRTVIHPQFHPLDPEWLEFAGDPAPRMHCVRRDGSGMESLYQHDNDCFVVHETFLGRTNQLVFTIWPRALCCMDWTSREHRVIRHTNAWHITPNRAGTKILCDTNHPDRGIQLIDVASGDEQLVCLSQATSGGSQWRTSRYALAADFSAARSEAGSARTLSWMEAGTDTVYGPQWTHPHPSFSPDETKVVFASDRTGYTQVFVADLPA